MPFDTTIKPILPTFVSGIIRRDLSSPSSCYLDVNFLESTSKTAAAAAASAAAATGVEGPLEFDSLVFQNFYTASISISQQVSAGVFVVILESKQLMPDASCETGAQNWYSVSVSEFNDNYYKGRSLRVFMIQPSALFSVYEIRCCNALGKSVSSPSLSSSSLSSIKISPNKLSGGGGGGGNPRQQQPQPQSLQGLINSDMAFLREIITKKLNSTQQAKIEVTAQLTYNENTKKITKKSQKEKKRSSGGAGTKAVLQIEDT